MEIDGVTYQVEDSPFALWLDHQGGVVKQPSNPVLSSMSVMLGMRPNIFPGWNWFSMQWFDGRQFTGFANKPWMNKASYRKNMLQGTLYTTKPQWVHGTSEITRFWRSPESDLQFGVEYTFVIGKETFYVKAISNDQRVTQEGIENYEGGGDIYNQDGCVVGFANIECIGWPNVDQRLQYALQSMGVELPARSTRVLRQHLMTDVLTPSLFILLFFVLITALMVELWLKRTVPLGGAIVIAAAISVALFFIVFVALKSAGCSVSNSCAIGPFNGCMFVCPS